jgi:type IV pilus assembly protein PilQ
MRKYLSRILCHGVALLALLTVASGCVKRMSAVNEPSQAEASAFATLHSVTVSADATRVELASDRPFTYTSYKAGEPPKIVVDIAQTEPGGVSNPLEVNRGAIRRIDFIRQSVGGGVLTRMEITLNHDADFTAATEPTDKSRLVVTLLPPEAESKAQPEPKEGALAEAKIEEKNLAPEPAPQAGVRGGEKLPATAGLQQGQAAPMQTAAGAPSVEAPRHAEQPAAKSAKEKVAGPRVNAIIPAADGVEVSIEGGVVQTFNSFRLGKPDRIVLDLFGIKSGLDRKVVPIDRFGIANARVGTTPDKVRIVLDAQQEKLPPFDVVKTDLGLKIRLKGERGAQPHVAAAVPPPAPVVPRHATVTEKRAVVPPAPAVSEAAPAASAALLPAPPAPAPSTVPAAAAPVSKAALPPVPSPAAVKPEVPPAHVGKGSLESLDFKVVDGVSRISMKLYGSCEPGQPVHGVQGLSLTIRDCQVPKKLQRALDTSRFGSPVLSVTPYQVKVKGVWVTKLLVRVKGNPPFSTKRKGDLLVWDIVNPGPLPTPELPAAPVAKKAEPVEEVAAAPAESAMTELPGPEGRAVRKAYHGRRVTLEFSDADIRKIFQLIAEVSNLNFLISDDVTGTISIKLVNVPWDQALDVILDAKGLGMQREGNIVQIKPKAKILTQADEEAAAKKAAELAMPVHTAVFDVNYAAVSDVAAQFERLKSPRPDSSIVRDERTNRVIVTDVQPRIDTMRQLLKNLDTPEKQVMIEARIVEATSTFTRDLGVQWGLHYRDGSASVMGISQVDTGFGGVVSSGGPGSTGAGGIGLGMAFGKLGSNVQLDMRLSAAATIGQVKIISTPKVVTLNNKAAKISQGQSIPYQTTSAEGTKTEFVEAALTLEVTPHITAEGAVSMKIKASNNSPGAASGGPPAINKKEATTELVVANGETTVIGGIYVDSDTESDTGVPFLSDIPLLGWLFKSNSKQKTKTELLIFITPKVVI